MRAPYTSPTPGRIRCRELTRPPEQSPKPLPSARGRSGWRLHRMGTPHTSPTTGRVRGREFGRRHPHPTPPPLPPNLGGGWGGVMGAPAPAPAPDTVAGCLDRHSILDRVHDFVRECERSIRRRGFSRKRGRGGERGRNRTSCHGVNGAKGCVWEFLSECRLHRGPGVFERGSFLSHKQDSLRGGHPERDCHLASSSYYLSTRGIRACGH